MSAYEGNAIVLGTMQNIEFACKSNPAKDTEGDINIIVLPQKDLNTTLR